MCKTRSNAADDDDEVVLCGVGTAIVEIANMVNLMVTKVKREVRCARTILC